MHELMEFVFPIVFSSGEALIAILIVVTLFAIGRGKIVPSQKPLVIERAGQYSMALAPGLNLAQPFIEAIAKRIVVRGNPAQDCHLYCLEVRDKDVSSATRPCYLLSISLRNGVLHFDARFGSGASELRTAGEVLDLDVVRTLLQNVEQEICHIADSWGISIHKLE